MGLRLVDKGFRQSAGSWWGRAIDDTGKTVAQTWGGSEKEIVAWFEGLVAAEAAIATAKTAIEAAKTVIEAKGESEPSTPPRESTPSPVPPASFDEPTTPPNPMRRKGR